MNISGASKILKIYISEDSVYEKHNLYHAIVAKLKEFDVAGVTVTRGIEGYGQAKRLRTVRFLPLSDSLPIIIEAIDIEERLLKALPAIEEMVDEGLIMMSDVQVIKYGKNVTFESSSAFKSVKMEEDGLKY